MLHFTSKREKRFWIWSLVVTLVIFATLFVGRPLATQLQSQIVKVIFFVSGMVLVGAAMVAHAISTKPGKIELALWLGLFAVYVMFIFRLGAPERSHVIEYSVLAICIHKAFAERAQHRKLILPPAILALLLAFLIGVMDESIQIFLPNRSFDPQDILFNGLAATMAIGSAELLSWVRKRWAGEKHK